MTNILTRPSRRLSSSCPRMPRSSPSCVMRFQHRGAGCVVDRPPVVGIDEVQIPQLGALIEVGNAGRGDLDQQLREAVVDAELGDARLERQERLEERGRAPAIEDRVRRTAGPPLRTPRRDSASWCATFASRSALIM